jgi:hypothetical protein
VHDRHSETKIQVRDLHGVRIREVPPLDIAEPPTRFRRGLSHVHSTPAHRRDLTHFDRVPVQASEHSMHAWNITPFGQRLPAVKVSQMRLPTHPALQTSQGSRVARPRSGRRALRSTSFGTRYSRRRRSSSAAPAGGLEGWLVVALISAGVPACHGRPGGLPVIPSPKPWVGMIRT